MKRMNRTVAFGIRVLVCVLAAQVCNAADLSGKYIAEVTRGTATQFARVTLKVEGSKVSGSWGDFVIDGTAAGTKVDLRLTQKDGRSAGTLSGVVAGDALSGSGSMTFSGGARGGGGGARGGGATEASPVEWKLTAFRPPDKPKTYDFEPKSFYTTYSAAWAPVLHIYPGDTVRTRTIDNARDSQATRYGTGGNPSTGPFYIDGALPGDTLVVHLVKVRANRTSAQQGTRINAHAVTAAYLTGASYDTGFSGEWTLDLQKGVATPARPTERMKGFTVPIKAMLGCVSVAPSGDEQFRGTDLGPYGGNLDYNDNVEGTTLYFPVTHAGALFGVGDAHAAMGDGEVTGSALETSVDVEFTVDLIPGEQTQQVRAETKDYLISFGVTGSVADSIQAATTQLVSWLKKDYGMTDSEVALFLGAVLKYDIAELVDPHYNIVAKVAKSSLATFRKTNPQ
jgi:amidase